MMCYTNSLTYLLTYLLCPWPATSFLQTSDSAWKTQIHHCNLLRSEIPSRHCSTLRPENLRQNYHNHHILRHKLSLQLNEIGTQYKNANEIRKRRKKCKTYGSFRNNV